MGDTVCVYFLDRAVQTALRYLDRRCPLREFKIKGTDTSWMSREVKELIAEKGRRIVSVIRHKRPQDLTEANRLRLK